MFPTKLKIYQKSLCATFFKKAGGSTFSKLMEKKGELKIVAKKGGKSKWENWSRNGGAYYDIMLRFHGRLLTMQYRKKS